ncbi:MAG TPA: response regulator transcription factor [Thermoanaerobaculia bacterium]|nr:response regulator transcription factor [Thermoanaerobaculia bacterium]
MAEKRSTVILADDHPMVLAGLQALLAPTLEVLGTVADGQALLEAAESRQPDLVIADIAMPALDGLEATRRLASLAPRTRVVILSCHAEASWARAAFEAGASAYLTKSAAPADIETAVREVLAGNCYVSPSLTRAMLSLLPARCQKAPPAEPEEVLTPREQAISRLVGQGLHNKEIARRLGVSVTTVRTHLSNVYSKLGGLSRIELALQTARTAALAD